MDETEVGRIASWVGLDVGKEDHHATVVSAAGERLFELAVRNDEAAIERLLDRALESGPCALVIDQPGSIGSLAVCLARRRGVPVAYVPGLVMRRASELYPGEAKTDRRDSFVLADTARTHARRLHWLQVSDETLERLRLLGGYDDDLAHDVNRAANRLRDMLLAVSPALERVLGPRLDHPVARALLARYPTPTALRAAGRRRLTPLCKRHAPRMGARLAQEIEQTFTSHPRAPVLLSIPGIGARSGARILTEIGDINRFPTSGHLAAYAGLAPVTRQSGSSINGETRSRRGNHRLKNAMWLSAFCSLHHDRSRDYYARKRSEGKLHNAAITCLARRRCDVIHAMLRSGLSYGELPGPATPAPEPEALAA